MSKNSFKINNLLDDSSTLAPLHNSYVPNNFNTLCEIIDFRDYCYTHFIIYLDIDFKRKN